MAVGSRIPAEEPAAAHSGRPPGPARSGLVPPLADGFISRAESAADLGPVLTPGAAVALVPARPAAPGAPGWPASCGKTQLAVACAESLWRSRGVELLAWVVATSRASVLSGYVAAAAAAGIDPARDAESVAASFAGWLAESSRPWLVVLDGLQDPADLTGLWPAPAGQVLITANNAAAVPEDRRVAMHPVGTFSSREALSYLIGRLTADTDQRFGAVDLVEALGCEPLALAQASAAIATSSLSCHDYRGYFARRREQLAHGSAELPVPAAVTWMLSFELASRQSPDGAAQALLAVAALLDGHEIPATLFTTAAMCGYLAGDGTASQAEQERARSALLILEQAGLVTLDRQSKPPTVRMNPVVQAAARATMPDRVLDRAAGAAADALLELWPADEQQPWLARGLRACAASLQQAAGDRLWAGACHPLLLRAGESLDRARLTGPAIAYWSSLATTSDRNLGSASPDTLLAGQRLADAYLAAGRAAEAVPWLRWILAKQGRELGPDHPSTIAARRSLGHALAAGSQLSDAVTILGTAVTDYERVRGADHPDTLAAREELAAAYRTAGQLPDAIRLYKAALADRERTQGARHADTIMTRERLAAAYQANGQVKDAVAQYKRALADRERVFGTDHIDTIAARGNLGSAYVSAGRMASAIQLYEQACAGYERALGPDHPDVLPQRANLAHAYYAAGRLTDAATMLRDTVARCERVLPPGDPLTKKLRESLTNIAGG